MTRPPLGTRSALIALGLALGLLAPVAAEAQHSAGRQVVVFGVLATPGSNAMDSKITPVVGAQLRRALPNHGFKLIEIKSDRVTTNQSVVVDLGSGFTTSATLTNPLDANGKVQMRVDLSESGVSSFQTILTTPADQFNFFDKQLANSSHLLIGVGAR